MIFTPDGKLLVYAYNLDDENNMDCVISNDCGKTWGDYHQCYLKNRIRNPQVNILDNQYILHGRAGTDDSKGSDFVLYTSKDGINWDDGTILIKHKHACFYSNNIVIKFPDGKDRMLIQYSENYDETKEHEWSGRVNVMHLWVETAD